LIVKFDPSRDERARTTRLDETWQGLQDGGQVLMPQDEDPFSKGYGWVKRAQKIVFARERVTPKWESAWVKHRRYCRRSARLRLKERG
jgi:hypothetical protein